MSTQICRGFTDEQWRALKCRLIRNGAVQNDDAAWDCAIKVFEKRITERFLSCIDALERADSRADIEVPSDAPADCSTLPLDLSRSVVVPGFAIMALCCLLVETLASFREPSVSRRQQTGPCPYPDGECIRPQPTGGKLIRNFLQRPSFKDAFADDKVAKSFVRGIRDGILHEAETRRWRIWREEPKDKIVEREATRFSVNRTAFYQALRQEFQLYVAGLRDSANLELRKCFVEKMGRIVKEC
jgi:hypothetical protein